MTKTSLLLVALCQILTIPILGGHGSDSSPFEDMVSSFMQQYSENGDNNLPGMLSSVVGTLMQGDNAKNLGALFGQANNGNNAGELLSGLGSLLGGQNGQIDPSLVGSMVSMFAQQMAQPKQRQKRENQDNDVNLDSILNLASGFLGNKNTASFLPLIMNGLNALSGSEAEKLAKDHKDHASFLPPFLEKAHLYWDIFINSELGRTVWEKSGMKRAFKSFEGPDGKISFELMFKNFENHSFRRHWIKAAAKYLTDIVVHMAKPEVYQRYLSSAQYILNSFLEAQGMPKSTYFDTKRPEKSLSALINQVLKKYLDMDTDVTGYVKPAVEYIKQTLKMAQTASQNLASRGDYSALADRVTDTLNLEVIEPVLRVYRAYKHSVKAPHCQEHLMCLVNKHPDQEKHGLPGFKAGLTKFSSLAASAALSFQNGKGFWDLYNAIQSDVNCEYWVDFKAKLKKKVATLRASQARTGGGPSTEAPLSEIEVKFLGILGEDFGQGLPGIRVEPFAGAKYPADCAAFHEHELKVTTEVYHSEL